MANSASHVSEGVPQAGRRARRQAGFPTTTVDLRRPVAGIDHALAWMSMVWGLRRLGMPLARLGRRIIVHVHAVQTQPFVPAHGEAYEMLQLWMSNGATADVTTVRCQTRWTTDTPLLNVKTEPGFWLHVSPFEGVQHLGNVSREADLPAVTGAGRVGMQYLGLAIKYPDDEHAYVVTDESYRSIAQEGHTWRYPAAALAPGRHFVDVALRAADGPAALLRLRVLNLGRGGPLKAELVAGQLRA